jgi:hypothetical protein
VSLPPLGFEALGRRDFRALLLRSEESSEGSDSMYEPEVSNFVESIDGLSAGVRERFVEYRDRVVASPLLPWASTVQSVCGLSIIESANCIPGHNYSEAGFRILSLESFLPASLRCGGEPGHQCRRRPGGFHAKRLLTPALV